jgi:hypothetical protein
VLLGLESWLQKLCGRHCDLADRNEISIYQWIFPFYVSSIDPFSIVVYPIVHFAHVRSFQCCWNSPFAHLMQDSNVKNVPGGQSVITRIALVCTAMSVCVFDYDAFV